MSCALSGKDGKLIPCIEKVCPIRADVNRGLEKLLQKSKTGGNERLWCAVWLLGSVRRVHRRDGRGGKVEFEQPWGVGWRRAVSLETG